MEGTLESVERKVELPGLVVLPAEVVEQRPEPVRRVCLLFGERDSALRPRDEAVAIRSGQSGHVRGVRRDEPRLGFERLRERGLEQRESRLGVAARTPQAAALEVDAGGRDSTCARERVRFHDEPLAGFEVAP